MLTVANHDRDLAGLTYVYPVLSRRAGGVSVGINLNPNDACNWRCAYCQVPNLVRGKAPKIDLARLEDELRGFLVALVQGDWLAHNAPADARTLKDIAFSGNGEPTSAAEFADAVTLAARLRDEFAPGVPLRLISNGSLLGQARVREGIRRLAAARGEVWFKVDAGDAAAIARINGVKLTPRTLARHLAACAALCPTWVQTCVFRWDGAPATSSEVERYLDVLAHAGDGGGKLAGVLLYGVARPPTLPEGAHVGAATAADFTRIEARIKEKGLTRTIRVSP
ncbi:MAG: radical SAM protein [Azoarcus sp.]|jgi:wyosine [tRNA(Phe)-imidazoG37] synthetase (radical SAM superfamily)|nr:radical SAM protein [Azoarcus sp.]